MFFYFIFALSQRAVGSTAGISHIPIEYLSVLINRNGFLAGAQIFLELG